MTFLIGYASVLLTRKISEQKEISTTVPEVLPASPIKTEIEEVKKAESPVNPLGDFSNVQSNGEHQWGYSIELWKQDDKIYGLISGDDGTRLIGDPPTGLVENVQFDPGTKKFSFRAKLPSERFEFEGILTKKKIEGERIIKNEFCLDGCAMRKKIVFPRSKESSLEMTEYQTYRTFAEWKKFADRILKFRGPEGY
jgi:hypothetical protein